MIGDDGVGDFKGYDVFLGRIVFLMVCFILFVR